MKTKRLKLSVGRCASITFGILFAIVAWAGVSSAQSIPGTLSSVETTRVVTLGVCTQTFHTWTWSFLDPQGASHAFPGTSLVLQLSGGTPTRCPHSTSADALSTWSSDGLYFLQGTVSGASITETVTTMRGYINPKYVILGVTYAPPGTQSFVTYSDSTTLGTSTALMGSFSTNTALTVAVSSTLSGSATLPNIAGKFGYSDTQTNTFSKNFTDEQDSSSSVALSSQVNWLTSVPGPASPYVGVDHDYDIIWLWLNPLLNFQTSQSSMKNFTWTGYSYDADDIEEMEIYGVYLGWLTGHLSVPGPGTTVLAPLERTWAGLPSNGQTWLSGQSPSLVNPTDYAAIAAADPFSSSTYSVTVPPTPAGNLTSSDGRFTLTGNQVVDYEQPPPGGQPFTQQLTETTTETQTQGKGAKETTQVGYSWENKFTGSFLFASWSEDITNSKTLTFQNMWSTTNSSMNAVTATASVTGPPCNVVGSVCSPVYTGPTEYEVFQDNIYGTYMFYPKP